MAIELLKIIREGTRAVPATKYALGIAALGAVIALIASFQIDLRIALWGVIILLGLMILLVVFARLTQTAPEDFRGPVRVMMWSIVILFVGICCLLTSSVFFSVPVDLQYLLRQEDHRTVIDSAKTSSIASPPIKPDTLFKHVIGVNYMRLFGAAETTLVLPIMEAQGNVVKGGHDYPYGAYHPKGKDTYLGAKLIDFWKQKWEYKDALPIRTELWERFSGKPDTGFNLYWNALNPIYKDIAAFTNSPYFMTLSGDQESDKDFAPGVYALLSSMREKDHISLTEDSDVAETGLRSDDIGYLFVILTNTSDTEMFDLDFQFDLYTNPYKLGKINFNKFLSKPVADKVALTDEQITAGKNLSAQNIKLASLKPGKSFIWLLCIYKKKLNGMPGVYMTDVTVPKKLVYRQSAQPYLDTIRAPYGEKAARLKVPAGWYSQ